MVNVYQASNQQDYTHHILSVFTCFTNLDFLNTVVTVKETTATVNSETPVGINFHAVE